MAKVLTEFSSILIHFQKEQPAVLHTERKGCAYIYEAVYKFLF